MSAALRVEGLNRAFGALPVTRDVNLTLERGARHALIGPNGAGKTTLVNLITGALKPNSGRVVLNGEDITNVLRVPTFDGDRSIFFATRNGTVKSVATYLVPGTIGTEPVSGCPSARSYDPARSAMRSGHASSTAVSRRASPPDSTW